VNLRSPLQGLTVRDGPVKGVTPALQRQQRQDWDPQIELVGGKVRGPVGFAPAAAAGPELAIKGRLETLGVELDTWRAAS